MIPPMSTIRDRLRGLLERTDASTTANAQGSTRTAAAMLNSLSGVGTVKDSGASAKPNTSRDYLTDDELIAMLRGTVYRRIVEIYPSDATLKGWALMDDTEDTDPLADEQRRLGVVAAVRQADTWARALGESMIWLVTDDPGELDEPLDPSTVRRVHALQVLDAREFQVAEYQNDPKLPGLGLPSAYWLSPRRPGTTANIGQKVHASRLLRFFGHDLPPSERGYANTGYNSASYGDAVGQVLWDALRNVSMVSAGGARLAQELTIGVFKFANAAGKSAGDDRSSFLSRLSALNQMKSIAQAVFLGPSDDFQRLGSNASGFKDLSEDARLMLALVSEIPMARLFGEAPAGLSTDGASWQANWHGRIGAYQEERYREPLEFLYRCLYNADRNSEPAWKLVFNPLGEMTKAEIAAARLAHTQADSLAIVDGVLTPERIARSRYSEGTFGFEIQPPTDEDVAVDEAALAEFQAALARTPGASEGTPAAGPTRSPEVKGKASDIALNGAQVQAAQGIVQSVAAGLLPRSTGVEMLAAFFNLPSEQTERIMGEVGRSFTAPEAEVARLDALARIEAMRADAAPDSTIFQLPIPPKVVEALAELRASVEAIVGPVDVDDEPHLTLLFLGAVEALELPAMREAAKEALEHVGPVMLHGARLAVLGEETRPAIVVEYDPWSVEGLNVALLRAMAPWITARQFGTFRPHVTIGYVSALSEDLRAELLKAAPDLVRADPESLWSWRSASVEFRRGTDLVAVYALEERRDGEADRHARP